MGFDFSKLNPFGKKTLEEKAAGTGKKLLVISRSAYAADAHMPHCVRECAEGRNHQFSTKKELVAYIFQKYGNNFEIKEFERYHMQKDIDEYNVILSAERQKRAVK